METSHELASAVVLGNFIVNPGDADLVINKFGDTSEPIVPPVDLPTILHRANLNRWLERAPDDVRALWFQTALEFRNQFGTPQSRDNEFATSNFSV